MISMHLTRTRYKQLIFGTIVALTLIYAIFAYFFLFHNKKHLDMSSNIPLEDIRQLCLQDHCFNIQLAITPQEKKKGLMGVRELPEDQGMLFFFEHTGYHSFWMKNTLIPLDILRLDAQFTIVDHTSMTPCQTSSCPSYTPSKPAKYALEVASGTIQSHLVKTGLLLKMKK